MAAHDISKHPAGSACLAFATNSIIAEYNSYDYVEEWDEPLSECETKDGYNGHYIVIVVQHQDTKDTFKGYIRYEDGYDYTCTHVESYTLSQVG